MAGFVKRITVITGDGQTETLYRGRSKGRKRVSRAFRPLERGVFRVVKSGDTFSGTLLDRYRNSRGRRRNGWLRRGPQDFMKAGRKAFRKLSRI